MTKNTQGSELIETIIEYAMAESSREPDGERLWIKTSYELANILRPILEEQLASSNQALLQKVREMIGEDEPEETTFSDGVKQKNLGNIYRNLLRKEIREDISELESGLDRETKPGEIVEQHSPY